MPLHHRLTFYLSHQFMYRCTLVHLRWHCFSFSFTLFHLLLCYLNRLFFIANLVDSTVHLLISLGILLSGLRFIHSSKFRTACPRVLYCWHGSKVGIHPYFEAWIRPAHLDSFPCCLCNDVRKIGEKYALKKFLDFFEKSA